MFLQFVCCLVRCIAPLSRELADNGWIRQYEGLDCPQQLGKSDCFSPGESPKFPSTYCICFSLTFVSQPDLSGNLGATQLRLKKSLAGFQDKLARLQVLLRDPRSRETPVISNTTDINQCSYTPLPDYMEVGDILEQFLAD